MGLRDSLAKKPAAAIGIAVIVVGLSGWLMMRSGQPHLSIERDYYYDLESKKVIEDAIGKVPPYTTSAGKSAVRAAVFSCGNCSDAASRFVGYLEQYSEAYRKAMGDPEAFTPEVAEQGQLIRLESADTWVSITSPEGRQILGDIAKRCGEQQPQVCHP